MPYFSKTYGRIGATSTSALVSANGGVFGPDQVRWDKQQLPTSITPVPATTSANTYGNAAYSYYARSVLHFVYTQAELAAAGWTVGCTISSFTYNIPILTAYPTVPSYAVGMCHTALTSGNLAAQGLTTVRVPTTQNHVLGTNTITLTAPFAWNGTSNLGISLAWGYPGGYNLSAYATSGAGTTFRSGLDTAGTYAITDAATTSITGRPALTLFRST